jgi:hypothetical protein
MQRFKYKDFKKTGKIFLPVFLFLTLIIPGISIAQKHEFGLGLGGFNYTGELNPRYNFLNYKPAGTLFYRYNVPGFVTAIRLGVTIGQLSGTEAKSKELVAQMRGGSFKSTITEVSLMGEYNFINYRDKKQLIKFSPYLTGGVAIFGSGPDTKTNSLAEDFDSQGITFAIPFGVGMKFILNRNWNLGTEFVARKTFTDYLDGISKGQMGNKTTGNHLDDDWYYYTGITLSYTIYGINCPQQFKY